MTGISKYDFAFMAASLRMNDMLLVAKALRDGEEVDVVNDLGKGKAATGKRIYREMVKRVHQLTKEELDLLVDGDFGEQRLMAYLAVCKCYRFILDFVVEVLREKYLSYDYEIRDGEYYSFFNEKNEWHLEMDRLSDSSKKKIRQVVFLILEQAGIIDSTKDKNIEIPYLGSAVTRVVRADNIGLMKLFFVNDLDL